MTASSLTSTGILWILSARNIFWLALIMVYTNLSSQMPENPSAAEKTAFDQKLARLKTNISDHPKPVTEVLNSLNDTITKMLICPPGSMVEKVTLKVLTKQIKWRRSLTLGSTVVNLPDPRDIGWYVWNQQFVISDGMKVITACNYVLLDSSVMVQQEAQPPFGPIADEVLLYHEMLHGQMVIDSFMSGLLFQKEVCNCNFNLAAADYDHANIGGLEEEYARRLLRGFCDDEPKAKIVNPLPAKADKEGKFCIDIGPESLLEGKEEVSFEYYFPVGSNVDPASLDYEVKDGRIQVKGKLIDPKKQGTIVVLIDPACLVIFAGLEKAILIEPAADAIPTLSEWGLILLIISMMITGLIALKARIPNFQTIFE